MGFPKLSKDDLRLGQILLGVFLIMMAGMEVMGFMIIAVGAQFLVTQKYGDIMPIFDVAAMLKIVFFTYMGTTMIMQASMKRGSK